MIRLRHVRGERLEDLELALEKIEDALNVVAVTRTTAEWTIHFTTDQLGSGKLNKKRKVEVDNGTNYLEKRI